MYKYVVFSPYFGKLPKHFQLWLNSCAKNSAFKFIVFTDDETRFAVPSNVDIVFISFDSFTKLLCKRIGISKNFDNPYKLCDFKPTYGFAFPEYVQNCAYWGHCDLDLIFGDLEHFLPTKEFDKISRAGHFCLYRNVKNINEAFMLKADPNVCYRDILESDIHFGFDEVGSYGINEIFKKYGYSIFEYDNFVADIACDCPGMVLCFLNNGVYYGKEGERVFLVNDKSVVGFDLIDDRIERLEYAYIHFQKRKMAIHIDSSESQYIISFDGFHPFTNIDQNVIKVLSCKKKNSLILRYKFKLRNFGKVIKRKSFLRKLSSKNKNEKQ